MEPAAESTGGRIVARKVFYSFHYVPDNWRAGQVRNIGIVEGNRPVSDNDWEAVKRGGDAAIQRWIDSQLSGKSCAVVLIGSATAGRKWINYEIKKTWEDGKGLVGIYIHNLADRNGNRSSRGKNPFYGFTAGGKSLSSIVRAYDPPHSVTKSAYNQIADNLEALVEEAISIRDRH